MGCGQMRTGFLVPPRMRARAWNDIANLSASARKNLFCGWIPARVRDNGDRLLRRLLQENGFARRRSRLKIQAGCSPPPLNLPDPKDVDPLRSATAGRLVSKGLAFLAFKETCRPCGEI